jgi:hypothetical protein
MRSREKKATHYTQVAVTADVFKYRISTHVASK